MDPKVYTLEKARSALPLVRRVTEDIRSEYMEILGLKEKLQEFAQQGLETLSELEKEQALLVRQQVEEHLRQFNEYMVELKRIGVELKDPQRGLVDFYAKHEGRLVYLCWMFGEETIDHWHELETGYAGRRPASELENPTSRN